MPQKGYRIRSYVNGKSKEGTEYKNYSLTVPSTIAEALPTSITFVPRMTEEGLLYVPVNSGEAVVELPAWAQPGEGENSEQQEAA